MSDKDTKISAEVKAIADAIKKEIKIEGGTVIVPSDVYVKTLPEGLSEDQVKAVQKHNSNFFPAATLAVGDLAIPLFKKDKTLEQVSGEFKMVGRDHFDVTINRSRESRNPSNNQISTTYGAISATMVTHGAKASRGQMNEVKQHLQEAALKAYGEK
jgi:hypothetical protein